MDIRDQSGSPCCASFHGTNKPTLNQFRKCGGCPVAQKKLDENKESQRKVK